MIGRVLRAVAFLAAAASVAVAADCTAPAALRNNQRGAESHAELGFWFAERGQLACAVHAFTEAVRLDGKSFENRFNLGGALLESGNYAGAAEHLGTAARLRPRDAQVRFQHARALTLLKRFAEAREELKVAVQLDPSFTLALNDLGVLYQQQGSHSEAERVFRRAMASDGRYVPALVNLGLTLTEQKRFTESSQALRRAVELEPASTQALKALGANLVRMKDLSGAISAFETLVRLAPRDPDAHLNLGVVLADAQRQPDALKCFEAALALSPRSAAARKHRGRVLYEVSRYEEARADFRQALDLTPGDSDLLLRLAMTERKLGANERAAELLAGVVKHDPKNAAAHAELGRTLMTLDRSDDALAHLRRAMELNPSDSQTAYVLLRLLRLRESPEAVEYARRLRGLKQEELALTQARVLSNFGLASAKEEDWRTAVSRIREAIQTCGECSAKAVLRKNLGLILAQAGDVPAARKELEAAAALDPEDRDTRYALEVLPRLSDR